MKGYRRPTAFVDLSSTDGCRGRNGPLRHGCRTSAVEPTAAHVTRSGVDLDELFAAVDAPRATGAPPAAGTSAAMTAAGSPGRCTSRSARRRRRGSRRPAAPPTSPAASATRISTSQTYTASRAGHVPRRRAGSLPRVLDRQLAPATRGRRSPPRCRPRSGCRRRRSRRGPRRPIGGRLGCARHSQGSTTPLPSASVPAGGAKAINAAHVSSPTRPSTSRSWASWKRRTSSSVPSPK